VPHYYRLDENGVGTADPWLTEEGGITSQHAVDVTKFAKQIAREMTELNQYLRTLHQDAPEMYWVYGRLQMLHERLKQLALVQFAEGRSVGSAYQAPIYGGYNAPVSGGYQ